MNVDVIKLLIEYHADVNVRDRTGRTPLLQALESARASLDDMQQIVELLLQAGAAVSAKDVSAAAQWAARIQEQQTDAAVDADTLASSSPQHVTASTRLLKQMVSAAGSVDVLDSDGKTALNYAVNSADPVAVQLLLRAGATLALKRTGTIKQGTVLHDAVFYCTCTSTNSDSLSCPQLEVLALVVQAAAHAGCLNISDFPDAVCTAINSMGRMEPSRCNVAAIRLLLQHGASVADGSSLRAAVSQACQLFCSEHADAVGSAGRLQRVYEVVSVLLDAGATPNPACYVSPLEQAAEAGCEPLVQLLLQAGARCSPDDGCDALYTATNNGHLGVVQLLLDSKQVNSAAWIIKVLDCVSFTNTPQAEQVTANLLLHLQKLDGKQAAATALSNLSLNHHMQGRTAVRMAMLQGWAAAREQVDAEHAHLVTREQQAAAFRQGLTELALGFAHSVREQHVADFPELHGDDAALAQQHQQDGTVGTLAGEQQDEGLGVLAGAQQRESGGVLTSSSSILAEWQKPGSSGTLAQLQQDDNGEVPGQQQYGSGRALATQQQGERQGVLAQQSQIRDGSVDVLTQHGGDSSSILAEWLKPGSSGMLGQLQQHESRDLPAQQQQDQSCGALARQQQEEGLGVLAEAQQSQISDGTVDMLTQHGGDSSSILAECLKPGSSGMLEQLQQHDSRGLAAQQDQSCGALARQRQEEEGLGMLPGAQQYGSVCLLTDSSSSGEPQYDVSMGTIIEQHESQGVLAEQKQFEGGVDAVLPEPQHDSGGVLAVRQLLHQGGRWSVLATAAERCIPSAMCWTVLACAIACACVFAVLS